MAAPPLFRLHDPAGRVRYQDLKQHALSQQRVLPGTPGTLKQRTQNGNRYWVREYIRPDGKKTDEYLGADSALSAKRVQEWRDDIALARALAAASSTLRVLGYQRIDRKPAAVLAALFNRGLFAKGLVLVGSHAFGVLLNELHVAAPGYKTQDIDLARARALAIALPPGEGLKELLAETGMHFVQVPGMPSHRPSVSFKLPGSDALAVDLLVPGEAAGGVQRATDLGTHAQTIPLLEFLIEDPMDAIVLSPNQVIPVRVPAPENFVVHKLYSSQARRAHRDKAGKDLEQAAIVAASLEEEMPGLIQEALRRMPATGKELARRGARAASGLLKDRHPEALKVLRKL